MKIKKFNENWIRRKLNKDEDIAEGIYDNLLTSDIIESEIKLTHFNNTSPTFKIGLVVFILAKSITSFPSSSVVIILPVSFSKSFSSFISTFVSLLFLFLFVHELQYLQLLYT